MAVARKTAKCNTWDMGDDRKLIGSRSEALVRGYLERLGYRIEETNYRNRLGEIDIVAWDGNTLVFVEVRSRHVRSAIHPAATVTAKKRRQIVRVAKSWCLAHDISGTMVRFDIAAVTWPTGCVELIKNAFEAGC